VGAEKQRESRMLCRGVSDFRSVKGHVDRSIAKVFDGLGYRKSAKSYGKFRTVFTNAGRAKGVALDFAPEVDAIAVVGFPVTLALRFMPVFDVSSANDLLVRCFERGSFFKVIEPLVPNFGIYRGAWNIDELELSLHAYEKMLEVCIPSVEAVCAHL
jgi:hypothetical protein